MIEVGRNSTVIRNVDFESSEYKRFRSYFSLYDKVTHKYTFSAFTIIDNDIYIPTSVTEDSIKSFFPKKAVTKNYKTTAKSEQIDFIMKHTPRDDLQQKAIDFLLKMKSDSECRSRFLSLATGSGKTYVTINVISSMKKRALIVVDTAELAAQWKREFLNHTNLIDNDIRILSGAESIQKEEKASDGKIYIAIHRTLGNLLSEDTNALNRLMNKLKIGVRVFDESHVDFGNICKINSLSNVMFTIFLTATPSRSNFNDNSLYGKIFKSIPYFNGKDISNEKYHTVVMYKINSNPGIDAKFSVKTKYGFSSARWASYIHGDGFENFIDAFDKIMERFKILSGDKKTAILLPTIELIKKVKEYIEEDNPTIEIGTFIGEVKKEKRHNELSKQLILTNDKIFDKGIDVKDLEIVINFVPFGSVVKTEQIIGRLRYNEGKSAVLIDVTDIGFEECIKQSKIRKRFYKKKAKRIFEGNN